MPLNAVQAGIDHQCEGQVWVGHRIGRAQLRSTVLTSRRWDPDQLGTVPLGPGDIIWGLIAAQTGIGLSGRVQKGGHLPHLVQHTGYHLGQVVQSIR